ncbi:hypothetical protein WJS89_01055 [Sphingomicrobium sp. XHP0235]|uniref:hypothetical protein n=1 Tax=Sphingomicrobium aquimarinum TaxID=3133971 RepID=UPI0031FE5AAD
MAQQTQPQNGNQGQQQQQQKRPQYDPYAAQRQQRELNERRLSAFENLAYGTRFGGLEYQSSVSVLNQARAVARCVVASRGERAASLVRLGETQNYEAMVGAIARSHPICVEQMQFAVPAEYLQAAIAERLVGQAPTIIRLGPAEAKDFIYGEGVKVTMDTVARCVAYTNASAVGAYLGRDPSQEETDERSRLKALYASASNCGVDEVPDISPIEQRRSLALGLFQLAQRS